VKLKDFNFKQLENTNIPFDLKNYIPIFEGEKSQIDYVKCRFWFKLKKKKAPIGT